MSIGQQHLWTLAALVGCVGLLATAEKTGPKSSQFAAEPSFQDNFDAGWKTAQKDWKVATWKQNGTEMSPERCAVDDKGRMVQTVLAGEPYRGGSMQTSKEYPYGRWAARLKPSSVPGVLNSMFTMDWDDLTTSDKDGDGSKFEVDIEFLTYTFGKGRGKVHLAVHVPEKKNAFVADVELEFNPSDEFHVWGFDILPDRVVWHVDGKPLRTYERPAEYSFHPNYEFFFNSWTSPKWIKGPAKEDARYLIDWVKFYPQKNKEKGKEKE
ncbi:MAG: glycoside hydrolase family 16 protein [Planctomycetes bacterium]|nr:glycoside hydrolase family 16 protein [Planctomycetota bacterium]